MNTPELYQYFLQHPSVNIDSRKVKEGDIFFAIHGPNFNANQFAKTAIEAGASLAIIDNPNYVLNNKTILVEDSLKSLQELALFHRKQFNIPFIAITGSNGKTTTRELTGTVLAGKYKTGTTAGNLNNHIGIPLTLLSIQKDAEIAVIEMGANHIGEIKSYCNYTLPTHGLITNCGKAHLEGFGSIEGVRRGKGELFDFLRENGGTAFINKEYDYLMEMSRGIQNLIFYGEDSAITGSIIRNNPFIESSINIMGDHTNIKTQLVGAYNLPNILAAVCVGNHFGVNPEIIKSTLEAYFPSNSRSQLIEKGSNKIIMDAYNANPGSMEIAIENFTKLTAENKILLLGAMAELGDTSIEEHKKIISLISKHPWKAVVLVGGDFNKINHPYLQFNTSQEAAEWVRHQNYGNHYFLIKGSRSIAMEKLLEGIQ